MTSPAGLVLVTSRDGHARNWGSWCHLHPLGMLPAREAAQVLADRTGPHHGRLGGDVGAGSLADRLGRLPLALRIAGSFLAELAEVPPAFADPAQIDTYLKYREVLDRGDLRAAFPSRVASALTPDQAREIIDRTWELSLDQLESQQFPEARRLLRLLSSLADAPIPHELLLRPPAIAGSRLFAGMTGLRLWQVLQALVGFGPLELAGGQDQGAPRVIRLHPLVRDTSRIGITPSEQVEYLALAATLARAAAAPEATRTGRLPKGAGTRRALVAGLGHALVACAAGPLPGIAGRRRSGRGRARPPWVMHAPAFPLNAVSPHPDTVGC